jgi:starvation-inducible DNA-binding protein
MKASPTLTNNLQAVLADLIELHIQGKQAHWNIVGTNFRDLHLQLDEIVDAARQFADDAAERMRALHALPDGRSSTVAESTSLAPFPEGLISTKDAIERIVAALEAAVGTMRKVHDEVDEEDPTTADLLHQFIEKLEQFAWMVNAEIMKPTASVTGRTRSSPFRHTRSIQRPAPDFLSGAGRCFLPARRSMLLSGLGHFPEDDGGKYCRRRHQYQPDRRGDMHP